MPMENKSNTCWICGESAATGEHQQKKTDVKAMFGKGSYKERGVVKKDFDSKNKSPVQGPNSKELKYSNNLCTKCNNERTQPHDQAYEKFADYIRNNFLEVKRSKEINTNLVFGKDKAKREQQNLFRYFIKAFGCQLNDKGLPVPETLKKALLGSNFGNEFKVSVCINAEYEEYLQNFPLEGDQDNNGNPVDYFWAQHTGWFTVVYAYNRAISHEFGDEWYGKSRKFRTGKLTASKEPS